MIDDAPFVTFREGATSRELLVRHFPRARIVMELGSIAAVKGNVVAGIGIALISRSAAARDIEQGRLIEIVDHRLPVPRLLSILHRGQHRLPPAAAAFYEMLLEDRRADLVAADYDG